MLSERSERREKVDPTRRETHDFAIAKCRPRSSRLNLSLSLSRLSLFSFSSLALHPKQNSKHWPLRLSVSLSHLQLADVGIVSWGRSAKGGYEVSNPEDLRQLPSRLDAALSTPAARLAFVSGMEAALLLPSGDDDDDGDEGAGGDENNGGGGMSAGGGRGGHYSRLMQALLPMVSRGGGSARESDDGALEQQQLGDSFIRALLTSREAQADVAASLLAALPSLGDDGGLEENGRGGDGENSNRNDENAAPSSSSSSSSGIQLQRLVLAQFRWLEDVSDPVALTEALLGALCGGLAPQLRPDVLSFLPEVAPESGHAALLDVLEGALASDAELLAPVLECADALDLPPGLRGRVAALAAARLASAPPGALAAAASGELAAMILTGGIAFSTDMMTIIEKMCNFMAPVVVYPGEGELEALAEAGARVLAGDAEILEY